MSTAIAMPSEFVFQDISDIGRSPASEKLTSIYFKNICELKNSSTVWSPSNSAFENLFDVYSECKMENWDGHGALAITGAVYEEAKKFLSALPSTILTPNIVPEPDGSIGFEWDFGKNKIFVASVNATNYITYASILGVGIRAHGTEIFDGSIPQEIINKIKRIIS